ncbi:hypothetical protein K435DRAFT_809345 [Dendrothele bispora CBS 962.96]|uniref:Uncharacterized protein n=1 Tax=Dendrothele bispora (strain CBS 962.96) TaxID=1314807 RepID=A0A4S8KYJ4_DENBC|nr:hypothetical protein K435DRAFT_809345 [Dendrothele bispora CBS 962.96]
MASTRPSNPDFVSESLARSGGAVKSTGVQRRHSWDAGANVRARTTSSSSPPTPSSDNSANPLRAVSATFSRVTAQTQMQSIQMFNGSRDTRFTRSTVNNVGGDDRRHNDIYKPRFQNIRANIYGNANITLSLNLGQPTQAQEKNIPGEIALGLTHPENQSYISYMEKKDVKKANPVATAVHI